MPMKNLCSAVVLASLVVAAAPVYAAGWNPQGQTQQLEEAEATIAKFKSSDRGLDDYFKKAYGFAVFPSIGKGGFIFAGAFGRGGHAPSRNGGRRGDRSRARGRPSGALVPADLQDRHADGDLREASRDGGALHRQLRRHDRRSLQRGPA